MALLLADEAQQTLREALRDEDSRRKDWAIRFILNSKNARSLGWSSVEEANDSVRGPLINLTLPNVTWADGTQLTPPAQPAAPPLIDLAPAKPPTRDD
jgi:hypothetical protein